MKYLAGLLVFAAALPSFGFAQGFQSYTFEDIKWLSAPAVVVAKLEAAGYTVEDSQPDSQQLTFTGRWLGNRAVGTADFGDQNQLLRVALSLPAGGDAVYSQLRDTLTEQYGPPSREATNGVRWFTDEISGYFGSLMLGERDDEISAAFECPRWNYYLTNLRGEGTGAF